MMEIPSSEAGSVSSSRSGRRRHLPSRIPITNGDTTQQAHEVTLHSPADGNDELTCHRALDRGEKNTVMLEESDSETPEGGETYKTATRLIPGRNGINVISDAQTPIINGNEIPRADLQGVHEDYRESTNENLSTLIHSSASADSSASSSIYDSSYDTSSIASSSMSSSLLTSSLSSFEFSASIPLQRSPLRPRKGESRNDQESESSNEDDLANLISATMAAHGLALGQTLAERASSIDSIKWLGQHLPESVIQFLIDEIEVEEAGRGATSRSGSHISSEGDSHEVQSLCCSKSIQMLNCRKPYKYVSRDGRQGDPLCDQESYQLDCDQLDSDDDISTHGPLHFQESLTTHNYEHPQLFPRRHSIMDSGMTSRSRTFGNSSSSLRMKTEATAVDQKCTLRRSASLPFIRRSLDGSNRYVSSRESCFSDMDSRVRSLEGSHSISGGDLRSDTNNHLTSSAVYSIDAGDHGLSASRERLGSNNSQVRPMMASISFEQEAKETANIFIPTEVTEQRVFDPFPYDSDTEKQQMYLLREHGGTRTNPSIANLSSVPILESVGSSQSFDNSYDHDHLRGKNENFYFTDAIPPATRHDCALLFVDISGFTILSTTLGVEPLSKTINSYFQKIVDLVEAFGGDILKFAGDALFAEWQASISNPLESGDGISIAGNSQCSIEPWHGLGLEECVLTAAACGARIVDECSDYPVYESGGTSGKLVTSLNVHCGIGFGEVVGVHVGDKQSRMEYLILGDPIEQVAEAIKVASQGEVVASTEALIILEETAILDARILESDMDMPQVIATKATCFFRPKGTTHIQQDWTLTLQDFTSKPRERLAKRCDDWDLDALKRLKQRMSLYVHPVVVNDEFAIKVYPGDRSRAQERHRSEAELRGVFTVFIMPMITARLTGDDEKDCKVLVLLNDMMLIMTRELARFKGQMRQFIVDDKGVVLIANFGLRGSTFPNMVAERAIPFTTSFQTLLKTELNTECRIGATYGMAYCGVVGGVSRHEYAVLGPSVNLAARLMANLDNRGFLVDESVKDKAGSRQFCALPPVEAKGYANLVPIFEPMTSVDRSWKDISSRFVGRDKEVAKILCIVNDHFKDRGPSRFLLVSGEASAGKSALCVHAMNRISELCVKRAQPHLILRNAFSEEDVLFPFSIARPIFLDILVYLQDLQDTEQDFSSKRCHDSSLGIMNGKERGDLKKSLSHFIRLCNKADIPEKFINIITRMIVTPSRVDPIFEDDGCSSEYSIMMKAIAQYLVKAFLQCTMACELVVLALDDVSQMDRMSWKIVELLHSESRNLIIIGTCRPLRQSQELHICLEWWQSLHNVEAMENIFFQIELSPMPLSDVEALIAESLGRKTSEIDPRISQEVFMQSGGMPHLASEILENLFKNDLINHWDEGDSAGNNNGVRSAGLDVGNIGELVLHRMDSLPASVRTHLNLGAILGSLFELMDVVTVFEQCRGVKKEERLVHAKSVHESLDEAVRKGILEVVDSDFHGRFGSSDHPYAPHNTTYKFTHDVWRSNILRLTLDEWKRDMHSLIAQSMETVMDTEFADDYRLLTKLFCHWKESGSAEKAAILALKMGRSLENIGLTRQGLVVYHESLDMWKAMDNNDEPDESIGGLSMQLLEKLESSEVEHIIRLYVALGRCYTQILDPKSSIKAYQTALNFMHKTPSSVDLVDRSIIFPVFSGLFVALRFGHNEDVKYEQDLVRMFLRETKVYNDFHFSRALAMRAEMLARHGKFGLAFQTVQEMQELYHVNEHSYPISQAYGSDRCGQCIAQSALWRYSLGQISEALDICGHVIQDLIPQMDHQNVSNYFQMLYPLIWVMKDNGKALDAMEAFDKHVVKKSLKKLDERGVTSDRPLHMPIMALLDMIVTSCTTDKLQSYIDWISVEKNGLFGSELNFTMGSCGRTADSITAEMCLILSHHLEDDCERTLFIQKGFELARDAIELTKEKEDSKGMIVANIQVMPIFQELAVMHHALPPEGWSRRLSCRW